MLTIERSLNIYAAGIPQIISLSQYDDDFRLVFSLYTSEGEFTIPSGTTAEVMGTKVDGNGYSASASISGSTVTVTGNKQMTACAGRNVYEIVLTQSGKRLATVNFILKVERAALDADTIQSETVLKELNAIIDSAATATEAAETATAAAESAAESARTMTIDPTLTQSGQAADAGVVGDEISGLKEDLGDITGLTAIPMVGTNQYIKTNGAVGSIVSYTPIISQDFKYAVIDCTQGDTFTINADGGDAPRVWCFVDSSDKILSKNENKGTSVRGLVLTAPANSAKLIINDKGGNISYIGDEYTLLKETISLNSAIGALSNIEQKTINYTDSYYIAASGTRTYFVGWEYGIFDANAGDYIIVLSAGIPNTTCAIFKYANNAYTPLISSDAYGRKAYVYEVTESGKYGINSNKENLSTLYIAHRSATQIQVDALENALEKVLGNAFDYAPALVERDNINRFSTSADMLLTSKLDCIYHDNFDRADSTDNIGYNFVTGSYIDEHDESFPVGISDKMAYSSNPSGVTGKCFKLFEAEKFPYVVAFSAPDGYTASLCINYTDLSHQINVRMMGGTNDRYIRVNYAGLKPEVNYYGQYRKFTRVSVCVWPDHFDIYLDGRYFQTIEEEITSTLCGMMFSTGANYRYNWFSVSHPSEFEEIGFDAVVEDYGLLQKGYVTETGNANGVIISTENTLDSKKSIRFRLNRNDELASGSKRSEIGLIQRKKHNLSNKVYSFDICFSEDYLPDSLYEIIFQLHTFADDDNYAGLVPSTSLTVQNNYVIMSIRGQSDKAVDGSGSTITTETLFEIERNKWYHFLIYQRESYTEAGHPLTVCFVDGECKFFSENINAYNADNGTFPKWGIYKTPWKDQTSETEERTIFVDNIRMWY